MSTATSIEWTETTWNPTTGCDRISPGCDHCYALTLAVRLKAMGQAKYSPTATPEPPGPGSVSPSTPTRCWSRSGGASPERSSSTAWPTFLSGSAGCGQGSALHRRW
jgi:hypothetical protein